MTAGNFDAYPVLRFDEMPRIEVHIQESSRDPAGVGEMAGPPLPPALANGGASAELNLPQKLTISSYNRIDERWVIVGDISWIGWSDFEEIRIKFADGRPDSVTPADWVSTISLGP